MKQRGKNICITWSTVIGCIFGATTIILMSIMFANQPSSDVKQKYTETIPSVLTDIQNVKCTINGDNCGNGCTCYEYTFSMVDKVSQNCTFTDLTNAESSDDDDDTSDPTFSYEKIYHMYYYTHNKTVYCDPSISKEYHIWIQLIISTSVFAGLTVFFGIMILCACSCCVRFVHFCCSFDYASRDPVAMPLYPSNAPPTENTNSIACDCGC